VSVADRIECIPDPAEPVPLVAWPTLALFVAGLVAWFGSSALAVAELWPWPLSVLVNWAAVYLMFTVAHEASHHAASSNGRLNRWLGRVSTFFVGPIGFPVWRFVHMQHHRFVNDEEADPDYAASHSEGWKRPFRWGSMDLAYLHFYLPRLSQRPRPEKVELIVTVAVFAAIVVLAVILGWALWVLLLILLPARLNALTLGWSFDYLPHCGLGSQEQAGRFRTTRNRVGLEWLMTPLMLYQNYHLVHHLHPVVPFYRYLAVWRRRERQYLERDPALSTPRGRPLSTGEYRRLRALEH
jgi:fatty acid desaturase